MFFFFPLIYVLAFTSTQVQILTQSECFFFFARHDLSSCAPSYIERFFFLHHLRRGRVPGCSRNSLNLLALLEQKFLYKCIQSIQSGEGVFEVARRIRSIYWLYQNKNFPYKCTFGFICVHLYRYIYWLY